MIEDKEKYEQPDYKSDAYNEMLYYWDISKPMFNGKKSMNDATFQFLEKWSSEERSNDTQYDKRKKYGKYYNVYGGTIKSALGFLFTDDITPQALPTKVLDSHFADIDCCGHSISAFLRETALNGIRDGHSFILTTAPPKVETENPTLQDVADRRAYWINIQASQVGNWEYVNENGRDIVTRVTIQDSEDVKAGRFGSKRETIYKEFIRGDGDNKGMCFIWKQVKDDKGNDTGKWLITDELELATTDIPLVPYYTNQTGFFTSRPPYFDLAELNLCHYNDTSTLRHTLKYIIPITILKFNDLDDAKKFTFTDFSMNNIIKIYGEHAEASRLELTGSSIDKLVEQIVTTEKQMGKSGLEKFAPIGDEQIKTAYEIGSDNRENLSQLGVFAKNLEDTFDRSLKFLVETEQAIKNKQAFTLPDNATINLNFNYDKLNLNLQYLTWLASERDAGGISVETYLEVLAESGVMPKGWTKPIEMERLERSGAIMEERNKIAGVIDDEES